MYRSVFEIDAGGLKRAMESGASDLRTKNGGLILNVQSKRLVASQS